MSPTNAELHQFIMGAFNDEELVTLCRDYFPEVCQNFGNGMTRNSIALALIGYCDSRGLLENLRVTLAKERPAAWQAQFAAPADPNRRIHPKTGIELIRIPAGPFLYGEDKEQTRIELPEYWVGRAPVTNAQFARFIEATGHRTTAETQGRGHAWTGSKWEMVNGADWRHPSGPKAHIQGKDNHPVVQVSWDDAQAFCDWAGLQLPSEQEWEKAARGVDGRVWPWGDDPPTAGHCNFNRNVGDTTPVGRYSPQGDSPYGCVDMAGNVWEWTASWYDDGQTSRVLRGGSWYDGQGHARVAIRLDSGPDYRNNFFDFRVAAAVGSGF